MLTKTYLTNLLKVFLSFFFVYCVMAAEDVLQFPTLEMEQRYHALIQEIRCPKCLNQSIADSNAGISEDLRNIIYEQIKEGKQDKDIKIFLKQRYGDFILYKPEVSGANLILWYGPLVVLLIVVVGVWMKLGRKTSETEALSLDEEALVDRILREKPTKKDVK